MPDNSGQRTQDHLIGLHFWVEYDGILVAEFTECTGLSVETEIFEYVEGGENTYTHKLPVRVKYSNITLKRGLDPNKDLFEWYQQCANGKIVRKNVSIMVYGPEEGQNKTPIKRWDLRRAFPMKWVGPDLRSDAGAVTVETLELAHEGFVSPQQS